jgi:hypothetical protein
VISLRTLLESVHLVFINKEPIKENEIYKIIAPDDKWLINFNIFNEVKT